MVKSIVAGEANDISSPPDSLMQADVCIIGAGLIGLMNALQYAKRGFTVVIIDELTEHDTTAYKVGESALGYTTAFLRVIGGLDLELSSSFQKRGVWFIRGLEGNSTFDGTQVEWALQNPLPPRWHAKATDTVFMRTMFQDAHIVRPEIESSLRDQIKKFVNISVIGNGYVRDLHLTEGDEDHVVQWRSKRGSGSGCVAARWIIDCSGRGRVLVKRFGHDVLIADGFETSAVWGQFYGCTDSDFGEEWRFTFPDHEEVQRDRDTLNLWGDGYWIWIIRLSQDRISVGVSFHRHRMETESNLRETFWATLRKYPMLDFLTPEKLLDFAAYRDVQHITDTYVSERRYAIAGDAASIIDAYYSQGISLALAESWHSANIVERDLGQRILDTDYIARVNKCALADWQIMRGMVKGKYGPAMADNRFFILDHMLDYLVFGASLAGRYRMARWLTDTGGRTEAETPEAAKLRTLLSRQLFLSQPTLWRWIEPTRVVQIIQLCRDGVERRARWRMDHGIKLPPTSGIMRADAPLPAIWRLLYPWKKATTCLTMKSFVEPEFLRPDISAKVPLAFRWLGGILTVMCACALVLDLVDTLIRRITYFLGRPLKEVLKWWSTSVPLQSRAGRNHV